MTHFKFPRWLLFLWIAALAGIVCYVVRHLNRPPIG